MYPFVLAQPKQISEGVQPERGSRSDQREHRSAYRVLCDVVSTTKRPTRTAGDLLFDLSSFFFPLYYFLLFYGYMFGSMPAPMRWQAASSGRKLWACLFLKSSLIQFF
jgi:hypothetical protein